MKKFVRFCCAAVLMSSVPSSAYAASTPVKVSLFPKLSVPQEKVVNGLDLGLIATNVDEVQGLQLGWIFCGTDVKMVGLQSGFIDKGNTVTGVQWGFYNGANEVNGLQLGFINVTERMKGIQVGLVNIIKQSVLPVMVIVNANF
jgi:hypothetical protein